MFKHSTQIRVRYAEIDQMGVVYHGNYFAYFEASRGDAIRALGMSYADIEAMGVLMVVVKLDCKYLRPIKYDELITVTTIMSKIPTSHEIKFINEIYNETGSLAAVANIYLYCMDKTTYTKVNAPKAFVDLVTKAMG
jgi:acyl-CoA thioester hydrolase